MIDHPRVLGHRGNIKDNLHLHFYWWYKPYMYLPYVWVAEEAYILLQTYRLMHEKRDKSKFNIFIIEKFKKILHSFTCILPDYMSHETTKQFWKISHFENMTAVFLLRYQNSLLKCKGQNMSTFSGLLIIYQLYWVYEFGKNNMQTTQAWSNY